MSDIEQQGQSNGEMQASPALSPVARPKAVWLVALAFILVMSQVLRMAQYYWNDFDMSSQSHADGFKIFLVGLMVCLALGLWGLFVLKPVAVRMLMALFGAAALFGGYLFAVQMLLHGVINFGLLAIRVAVPALAAWYLARPAFLEMCGRHDKYREQQAMRAYLQKRLMRR
ncbi:MAG TPA: hypothetical protein VIU93_01725 [Gallionellaceae bacterium]